MARPARHRFGFKTRVLAPVGAIILLLFGSTLWIINVRLTDAVRRQASDNLDVIASVFENFQELRGQDLMLRARNIQSDPRFKAVTQVGDPKTMTVMLTDIIDELNLQAVAFFSGDGELLAKVGFTGASSNAAVRQHLAEALQGGSPRDFEIVDGRLLEIAVVPVQIGGDNTGALLIGQEIGARAAGDFRTLTGCEQVLYDGNEILVSTLRDDAEQEVLRGAIGARVPPSELVIRGRHYLARNGAFGAPASQPRCRYMLLASMEPSLAELHQMQLVVLVVGAFGLLASVAVVRFILIRAAAPLDVLQAGAERIGRGDFGQLVEITSDDEFGELAKAFNEMTGRLKTSRENLEASIGTLRETRARLLQSEKLSAIGEFISGVAHELNNPLTVMIGFARLLQDSELPAAQRAEVRQIAEAAERCHRIVQSLLSFARQRPPERKPVCLNEILEGTARFLQYELRTSNVEIERTFDAKIPMVMADAHQLQQVFLNLLNNSRQAIEEAGRGGRIRLSTYSAGDAVRAVIEDNGPGIPEALINRIFDPFFTTKPAGKGTGLGLSVSYGIIKEHGGDIRVESSAGKGSTFIIDLPVTTEVVEKPAAVRARPDTHAGDGQKRVLIIDDETALLLLAQRMLAKNGIASETAPDGQSALEALQRRPFDAVCCDWKMPGLSGREIFDRLHAARPSLARSFLVMSGDVLNEQLVDFVKQHNLLLIAKPFGMTEFCEAVAEAVKRGGGNGG